MYIQRLYVSTIIGSIPSISCSLTFFALVTKENTSSSLTTKYAVSNGTNRRTECLNNRFPLPTLLRARHWNTRIETLPSNWLVKNLP